MKKILVSLAAASIVATAGMASDVDFKTSGQAVVYYNTTGDNVSGHAGKDLFKKSSSNANFGIQLNFDADLKNDFTFGSQVNYLGTLGLEKRLVSNTMQDVNNKVSSQGIDDDIYLSKLYIAKKVANTTVKLGRQELPKSLSPLAFSEGWNVFKNTFDAALVVNTDVKDTVIVGAYVAKGNGNGVANNMATFNDLSVNNGGFDVKGTAYMLTVQNKTLPMATVTGTYYSLSKINNTHGAIAMWGDVAVSDKSLPMGLKVGVQMGSINPNFTDFDTTKAFGMKANVTPMKDLTVGIAYSSVNDGSVQVRNLGGTKTPLYTQMIANQGNIALDNDTYKLNASYNLADKGAIIAAYGMTDDKSDANADSTELDLAYTTKVAGIDLLAAYVNVKQDKVSGTTGKDSNVDVIRVVARYNF